MDNKYILINFHLFTLQTDIFIGDNESMELYSKVPLRDVVEVITILAHDKDIYKVKLVGDKQFSKSFIHIIEEEESTKFSENKIKVEVVE